MSQSSTTPSVAGNEISGNGDAFGSIFAGGSVNSLKAKSEMNVTFNADVDALFSLSGALDTPSSDFFTDPEFRLEDLTTSNSLLDVSGPQTLSLTGSLTQGHHYRLFATAKVNGDLQTNTGRTDLNAEAKWNFEFTVREKPTGEVPEPGALAMLAGSCVTGVFAWRRRMRV